MSNPQRKIELKALPVRQPVGTYYVAVIPAKALYQMCRFDYRRIQERGGYKDFLGIQRELSDKRVREIKKYIDTVDAVFPTSIVISIDQRCVQIQDNGDFANLTISEYVDPDDARIHIEFANIATIIDGQHRLRPFQDEILHQFELSVSIFIDIDDATEAMIFSVVNLAQTKVNKSLVYDLFSLDRSRSPEKTCHEIVVALDRMPKSPFHSRIKRLGSATEGRFGETLSQATIVRGILPYISRDPLNDRDIGKRFGFWPEPGQTEFEQRIFYPFFQKNEDEKILRVIYNFFSAVRSRWPIAWESRERGSMLNKTNGFNGLIRFLRIAYLDQTDRPEIVSEDSFRKILDRIYLDDNDFSIDRFPPGSSGASKLYHALRDAI